MATIQFDAEGENGPIVFLGGANHWRMTGLEITRARPEVHMRHLVAIVEPNSAADHIVFDRVWVHGTAGDETKDGVNLNGMRYVAIVDSYFNDFHCIARKGSCTDAQAVSGGGGNLPSGPFKIENNFLEASGENILFGGAPSTATPADIEIRHNHFFKPLVWKEDEPGFVGAYNGNPYVVKNHFELKNAERVLFEDNLLENSWGGFSQTGFSILLSPVNQGGKCSACRVTDITLRFNRVNHVASGILLATSLPKQKTPSAAGERFSIHDLIFDDINGERYKGFGAFLVVGSNLPSIQSVKINHVTAFPPKSLLSIVNRQEKLKDFTIVNSLLAAGPRQIVSGGAGAENCARPGDDPKSVLEHCIADPVFNHNLIIGGRSTWPPGNIQVKSVEQAGVQDFQNANGGNYRLCDRAGLGMCKIVSPGVDAGTDGRDIGADVDAVEKAISGAE
jgi:hypothetical protein